ncbi:MAG: hypothetical protein WC310_05220 [Patescibacteria group bacterium]|jgi:hypothetical protein
MFGFCIALLIFVFSFIFNTLSEGISSAGHFLYIWNWVFGIGKVVLLSLVAFGITGFIGLGGAGAASQKWSSRGAMILGGLLGAGAGGVVSGLIFIKALIKNALLILGAYLITLSGTASMSFDQFDKTKLFVGLAIVVIALLLFRKKSKDSSK